MSATTFKPPARRDIAVLAMSQSGSDILIWSLVGAVSYQLEEAEELARHLDDFAAMVRNNKAEMDAAELL